MKSAPFFKDLILVGGGHSHALVLRKWAMMPLAGVRITLISPQIMTPYSGMLPGLIAGHYNFEQTHIDLDKLSLWANIRFIPDKVIGIDSNNKTLQLSNHPDIEYDVVSIDIGSTPAKNIAGAERFTVPIKPIDQFYQHWLEIQNQARQHQLKSIAVVGGGAGSVEVILSIAYKLRQLDPAIEYHLVTAAETVLPGYNRIVRQRVLRQMDTYKIHRHYQAKVSQVHQGLIECQNNQRLQCDEIIWCTQASSPSWPRASGLDCNESGFIKVKPTLQTVTDRHIFAAGDIAHMVNNPRPKAGVYAVRQAPVLFHNLRALLLNETLKPYKPQDDFLSLLALGEKTAAGSKYFLGFYGDWVWKWKDAIDRKFMQQFHQLPELPEPDNMPPDSRLIDDSEKNEQHNPEKRCHGCGGKIGSSLLQQALEETLGPGCYQPEDAVQITPDKQIIYQSVDAIKAPVQDPWLFGRIVVNHGLSDLYAMNIKPDSAQLLINLPYAGQTIQKRELKSLLQGISDQLDKLGCRLLGGHTTEAAELSAGIIVNGIAKHTIFHKSSMQPGDKLVLSKPLGIGVILAAAMQTKCSGQVHRQAIELMLQANDKTNEYLNQAGITACTDVTGFGLLGHLLEMCQASHCSALLNLDAIPVLPGAEELVKAGIKSSLYSQNRALFESMQWPETIRHTPRFKLLFDPQTSGGLLAAVPGSIYPELNDDFHMHFQTIGEVIDTDSSFSEIKLRYS